MRIFGFLLCAVFFSICAHGQYAMNLGTTTSPARSISHKIGYTTVTISYSSPAVKSRILWGELVPYDEVWRAGANYATTISFSENVVINDQNIDSGTYAIFLIPKKDKNWTLILSSKSKQWGAFRYTTEDDVLRINAPISPAKNFNEHLSYEIVSDNSKNGQILMFWGDIKVGFEIQTKLKDALSSQLNQNIEKAGDDTKWVNYIQAAEILINENEHLVTAMEWINLAEDGPSEEMTWNKQYYPKNYIYGHLYWIKAKILAGLGQKQKAIIQAKKMKDIEGHLFYTRNSESEKIDEHIAQWQNQ